MSLSTPFAGLSRKFRLASLGLAMSSALVALPQQAQALTLVLDFTTTSITENWGVATPATLVYDDFSAWGFSSNVTLADIKTAVLASLNNAYMAFPTAATDSQSPLAAGQRLNISFELGTVGAAPTNGDSEYYYFGVGKTNGTEDELGHACYGCVRSANQGVATTANASMVGVNFTNNLQGMTSLATTDVERFNILAGTIAHEFGHALLLDHPSTGAPFTYPYTNPGESAYSIMGTGATPTNMPDQERLKARAFSYAEFGTLINTVGTVPVTAVPEPSAFLLMAGGLGLLFVARRRRAAA